MKDFFTQRHLDRKDMTIMCLIFFWGMGDNRCTNEQTKDIDSLQTLPSKTSNTILDSVFLPEKKSRRFHTYFKKVLKIIPYFTLNSKSSNAILDSVFLPEHFPKQKHLYTSNLKFTPLIFNFPMLTLLDPPRYRLAGKCGVLSLLSSEEPLAGHPWIYSLGKNGKT